MRALFNNSGFTLIELVVVIAILAIMSLVALPRISGFLGNERKDSALFESYIAAVADDSFVNRRDNFLCISLKKAGENTGEALNDKYRENSLTSYLFIDQKFKLNEKKILKARDFSSSFTLSQVIFDGGMTVSEGVVIIPFYSDGTSENFTIRIISEGEDIYLRKNRDVKIIQKTDRT